MASSGVYFCIRPDVRGMKRYPSARQLSEGEGGGVFLDANEMPYSPLEGTSNLNRYAEQQPAELIGAVAGFFGVPNERLMVTRGADEAIDLIVRVFCQPGQDSMIICPPTFPRYLHAGQLNGTEVVSVPLDSDFNVNVDAILAAVREDTKLVFICTPNNPVGRSVPQDDIVRLCVALKNKAAIVVDEAYIDYSTEPSTARLIDLYDNLIVLRTLSKAMGLAGVRCGGLIAHEDVIAECLKVLHVYPIPVPVADVVLETLKPDNQNRMKALRAEILETKAWFIEHLHSLPAVDKVYPSDSNFVLVRFKDAAAVDEACRMNRFVLRNQSSVPGLENCIRITIGRRGDMEALANTIRSL